MKRDLQRALDAWVKNQKQMTVTEARHYLIYTLGTHNEDGTLTKEYGGDYTLLAMRGWARLDLAKDYSR